MGPWPRGRAVGRALALVAAGLWVWLVVAGPGPLYGLGPGVADYTLEPGAGHFQHTERFPQRLEAGASPGAPQSWGPACRTPVALPALPSEEAAGPPASPVFLLETSGREVLGPRQACAAESAARASGRPVVVVMLARTLDLRDNVTCHLYMAVPGVTFYTVNMTGLAAGGPLEGFMAAGGVGGSLVPAVHLSDVLRLLLLHRYGGFYHDLDYVILGSLVQYSHHLLEEKGSFPGELKVTNSALGLPAGHPVLAAALALVPASYRPNCWDCLGPGLLTAVLIKRYNSSLLAAIPASADLQVIPRQRMVPVHGDVIRDELWPSRPSAPARWRSLFANCSAVHFFSSGTAKLAVPRDPRYSAYALLGPAYCPLAYSAAPSF